MQYNVLEYLEHTVKQVPDKIAYANDEVAVTFKQVYRESRAIGTFLYNQGVHKQPVVVFMSRHPKSISAFFGVVYGGNCYVPIDDEMPHFRIELILNSLNPKAMICDEKSKEIIEKFNYNGTIYIYDEIVNTDINEEAMSHIRNIAIDTDPIYIVYTSGSTGIPKGVVANHRSVIDYIDNLSEILEINENTVFGNQTPLYLDASLKEVYNTIKHGATTYIIPKSLFMFPLKLVEFLNKYQINTVCWVVSALTMISAFKVLDKLVPNHLHTVAFGSEVFPIKQFKMWKNALPNAKFINLYGPTEATGMCCYFKVEREFAEDEVLPIGVPFKNTEIILLDNNDKIPPKGEVGEICVRGTRLTLGYYNNFEKTNEVFVQNPLNNSYPEFIYRTGDLGRYNERGELIFVSRKDYQIKHMGHRIELGEIEVNVNMIDGIKSACCIYNKEKERIVLFYVGDLSNKDITTKLKERLPRYMIPNIIESLETMPLTTNGKIDRVFLKEYTNKNKKGK